MCLLWQKTPCRTATGQAAGQLPIWPIDGGWDFGPKAAVGRARLAAQIQKPVSGISSIAFIQVRLRMYLLHRFKQAGGWFSCNVPGSMRFAAKLLTLACVLVALCGCNTSTPPQKAQQAVRTLPLDLSPPAETVIGNLGGATVAMPRHYVRLVEYEGDPHWLEKRKELLPQRTFGSKLSSFAVLVHMPTMKPLTKENYNAYEKRGFGDVEWMGSGVQAGSMLNWKDDEFLDPYKYRLPAHPLNKSRDYESLPDFHGLQSWRLTRDNVLNLVLDDKNRSHSSYNHHLHFGYEGEKIVAFIKCGSGLTAAPGGRNLCTHHFILWPEMKAEVRMQYGVEILPEWRTHQQKMRSLMLSFRTPLATATTALPSNTTSHKP